jgi:hypothetical protein
MPFGHATPHWPGALWRDRHLVVRTLRVHALSAPPLSRAFSLPFSIDNYASLNAAVIHASVKRRYLMHLRSYVYATWIAPSGVCSTVG